MLFTTLNPPAPSARCSITGLMVSRDPAASAAYAEAMVAPNARPILDNGREGSPLSARHIEVREEKQNDRTDTRVTVCVPDSGRAGAYTGKRWSPASNTGGNRASKRWSPAGNTGGNRASTHRD